MEIKAKFLLPASGIPQNTRLVSVIAQTHPDNHESGALIQFVNTGIYALYAAGVTQSCPQDWAWRIDIKALRLASGLTKPAAAALIGCPLRTYENWESGVNTPAPYVRNAALVALQSGE